MKRSGFRQLSYEEMIEKRKQALEKRMQKVKISKENRINNSDSKEKVIKKRKKRTEFQKINDRVWELCRDIKKITEENNCYTCDAKNLIGANCQLGHGKANGSLSIKYKYDLRNLHWQCFNCNRNLGGMSDIFIAKMERDRDGLAFLRETCYQENGYWKLKQNETIPGMDFLIDYEKKLLKIKESLL